MTALSGVSPIPFARAAAASGLTAREAPLSAFFCHNCLTEWPEPFCDECGRNLMPRKSASTAPREGMRGRGMTRERVHSVEEDPSA